MQNGHVFYLIFPLFVCLFVHCLVTKKKLNEKKRVMAVLGFLKVEQLGKKVASTKKLKLLTKYK